MTKAILPLLLLTLLSRLGAQEPAVPPPEEEEAPEALFDEKIGDVGVALEAEGTWTTRLAGGWGMGFGPEGSLPGLGYPGFEKGGTFVQQPDFSLTLRLFERYYLEVIYSGTLEDRSFLLGYDGRPGEFLQWVKAGNATFSVPSRAGQTLAAGRRGAPAAGAAVEAGPVALELLGRYEDGTRETRTYHGYRDTASALTSIDRWIRGRFFRLPAGLAPYSGIRVIVADPEGSLGTGTRYRDATLAEAVTAANGEIRLAGPATREFLVTWDGVPGTLPVSPTLGIAAVPVTVGGGTWYVLTRPGTDSAFERRNRYPVALNTIAPVVLVSQDKPVEGYSVSQAPSQDWFEVSGDEEAPFLAVARGIYPVSDAAPPAPAALDWAFRLPGQAATSYSLGSDVLPSSIIVIRNGLPVTFRFDASGTLRLDTPVYETDVVEVSFQRTTGNKATDLVLWQGGRWDLDQQNVEWALQGRWNMEKNGFTTSDLQSPGRVALSVAYEGSAGDWSWKLGATGGALLTDSTGHRRLYGLATSGTQASLDGNSLRPSALPLGGDVPGLSESARAALVFRNFWTNDPLTGQPQVSGWDRSRVPREAGGSGGWMGPYLVRGDGIRGERLAVMEADLSGSQWMGAQVYLDKGAPLDLRSTSAVSIAVRIPDGVSANSKLYFQAGSLSDDWDGTRAVRKIEYRSLPALPFFNQAAGVQQYFPVPEDSSWGNDPDGDGTAGADGTLVTRDLSSEPWFAALLPAADSEWQTVRLLLTDAERQRLQRTTGWRLVLVNGTGTLATTVLAGPVVFEGSTWTVQPGGAGTGTVNPVERTDPDDQNRQQLHVDWQDKPSWTVEGRHSPMRPAAYGALAFRYRVPTPAPGTLNLVLRVYDGQGRGVTASWPHPGGTGWLEGRIDLRQKVLTLGGSPSGSVTVQTGAVSWDRLSLVLNQSGADDGELVLADVEAVGPVWEPVGTTSVSTVWKQPAPWPSAELPVVSGLVWTTASQQSGLTSEDASWRGQTTLAGSLGPVRASGEASFVQSAAETAAHGAYQATLPLGGSSGPRLEWTDRFSDAGLRSERAVLTTPWFGTWDAQALAKGPPTSIDQDYQLKWNAALPGAPDWNAALSAQWYQSTPRFTELSGFGKLWVDSWSWLPPEGTAPFYLLRAQGEARGAWGPWSWELRDQNQVSQTTGPEVKWTTWGGWQARSPFQLGSGTVLTPSLSKSVDSVYGSPSGLPVTESASRAADWLWTPPGALGTLPFLELDNAANPWKQSGSGFQSGKVVSAAGFDWERQPTSEWTDLVLPSSAGTKLTTTRGQEGAAGYRAGTVDVHLLSKGINLFGALGSLPVFTWYRTDVWTWSGSGSWSTGTRPEDQTADAGAALRSDLVLTLEESLGLPVTYQGRWGSTQSHTVGTRPTWSLRRPADLPFELPRWLSPSAFRRQWVQDLSLALDLGWSPTPAPLVRDLQVIWKGRLLMSEKSELSLTTKWGQQWMQNLTVIGLEASLDLVLNF